VHLHVIPPLGLAISGSGFISQGWGCYYWPSGNDRVMFGHKRIQVFLVWIYLVFM
jgi:hypothetical protein